MAASPTDFTVDHGEERGQIRYNSDTGEVLIAYNRVELCDAEIHFWKGEFYQGSLDTEFNQLFYGNDGIDFRVDVPRELVELVLSEVVNE